MKSIYERTADKVEKFGKHYTHITMISIFVGAVLTVIGVEQPLPLWLGGVAFGVGLSVLLIGLYFPINTTAGKMREESPDNSPDPSRKTTIVLDIYQHQALEQAFEEEKFTLYQGELTLSEHLPDIDLSTAIERLSNIQENLKPTEPIGKDHIKFDIIEDNLTLLIIHLNILIQNTDHDQDKEELREIRDTLIDFYPVERSGNSFLLDDREEQRS